MLDDKVGNNRLNCFPADTYEDTYVRKGNPIVSHNCAVIYIHEILKIL